MRSYAGDFEGVGNRFIPLHGTFSRVHLGEGTLPNLPDIPDCLRPKLDHRGLLELRVIFVEILLEAEGWVEGLDESFYQVLIVGIGDRIGGCQGLSGDPG